MLISGLILLTVVTVVVVGGFAWSEQSRAERDTGQRLQQLAAAGATDVGLVETLALFAGDDAPSDADPRFAVITAERQIAADTVRRGAGVDLVLVALPDGTLLSHPDPALLGTVHRGLLEAALTAPGPATVQDPVVGETVLAVAPVVVAGGHVGYIGIGVSADAVRSIFLAGLWPLLIIGGVAISLSLVVVILTAGWLRRRTLGLDAKALARTVTYYDAGLDVGREGVVIIDPDGRLVVVNRAAVQMLGWENAPDEGTPTGDLGLPPELVDILDQDVPVVGVPVLVGERVLLATRRPAVRGSRALGAVITLEDRTELYSLADQVDMLEGFAWSLRLQAHETANRLHTVVSLIELGENARAVELATAGLRSAQVLADRMVDGVGDPALAALLLGKSAQAAQRGIDLRSGDLRVADGQLRPLDLVTVVGNLLDNAVDAVAGAPDRWVRFDAATEGGTLRITVTDSGPGVAAQDVELIFEPGWSSKDATGSRGLGLPLVRQTVRQRGGSVRTRPGPGGWFEVELPVGAA